MNPWKQLRVGVGAYAEALRMIFATQMWLALTIPVLLSLALYYGGDMLTDNLKAYHFDRLDDADGSEYLLLGIQFLLVYVTKFMNKYLVLMLLSPLLAAMSVHVEYRLVGNRYPWNWEYYGRDVVRALVISLRNMGIQLLWMAAFFLVDLVVGLPSYLHLVVYFAVAFYFYGFSFMDYASERRRLSVSESVKFTRKHWLTAYVLGTVYGTLFWIPNFGFALEPGVVLAPILGVVGGTIAVHKIVDLRHNPHAIRPVTAEPAVEAPVTLEVEQGNDNPA